MIDPTQIAHLIAEKIREVATRQENIPFLSGDLRKSVIVVPDGEGRAIITSNLPYARAVHDGRPAITIWIEHTPPTGVEYATASVQTSQKLTCKFGTIFEVEALVELESFEAITPENYPGAESG